MEILVGESSPDSCSDCQSFDGTVDLASSARWQSYGAAGEGGGRLLDVKKNLSSTGYSIDVVAFFCFCLITIKRRADQSWFSMFDTLTGCKANGSSVILPKI